MAYVYHHGLTTGLIKYKGVKEMGYVPETNILGAQAVCSGSSSVLGVEEKFVNTKLGNMSSLSLIYK